MNAPQVKFPKIMVVDERRSILVEPEPGQDNPRFVPVPIAVTLFESETTPGRIRVAFTLPVEVLTDEESQMTQVILNPPFRIESN